MSWVLFLVWSPWLQMDTAARNAGPKGDGDILTHSVLNHKTRLFFFVLIPFSHLVCNFFFLNFMIPHLTYLSLLSHMEFCRLVFFVQQPMAPHVFAALQVSNFMHAQVLSLYFFCFWLMNQKQHLMKLVMWWLLICASTYRRISWVLNSWSLENLLMLPLWGGFFWACGRNS